LINNNININYLLKNIFRINYIMSSTTFTAPSASAQVFYLSNADTTGNNPTAASFDVTDDSQPAVTYPTITTVFNQTAANARTWFKFYLDISQETDGANNIVGRPTSNITTGIYALQSITNTTTEENVTNLKEDWLKQTAREIFGTSEAVGLITNRNAVLSGYDSSQTTAASNLNTNLSSGDKVITNSAEITKLIFDKNPTRFTLAYNASIVTDSTYTTWPEGDYLGADNTVATNGSGSGAKITVKINSSNAIETIFITPTSYIYDPETGSGYAEGNDLTITHTSGGNSHQIKINSLNTIQAAMLNGTYDNSFIFGLTTGATIVASGDGDGEFNAGTTTGLTVSGEGGATVTVNMTSTTEIYSIQVTAASTSGNKYTTGETVTITNSPHQISIILTDFQAALLNATSLTDPTLLTPTSPPLQVGDKIRIKYSISSASGQTNVQGNSISYNQTYLVDYQLA
jgi:hypothetical protein